MRAAEEGAGRLLAGGAAAAQPARSTWRGRSVGISSPGVGAGVSAGSAQPIVLGACGGGTCGQAPFLQHVAPACGRRRAHARRASTNGAYSEAQSNSPLPRARPSFPRPRSWGPPVPCKALSAGSACRVREERCFNDRVTLPTGHSQGSPRRLPGPVRAHCSSLLGPSRSAPAVNGGDPGGQRGHGPQGATAPVIT